MTNETSWSGRRSYQTLASAAPPIEPDPPKTATNIQSRAAAMTRNLNARMLQTANFAVGLALLVMLFPIGGVFHGKPAGVRTAIELIAKKTELRSATLAFVA
ncbi:MAG: hypothetical protein ACT4OU_11325 [Hyphomicrobium sp.]